MIDIASSKLGAAKITVVGAGGGGNNAVDRMVEDGVEAIEFICANTDHQALERSIAPTRIQLGDKLTKGLGAGGDPEVGRRAAEESKDEIKQLLSDTDMLFITAGMGGGTGTGSAPIIASIARELGILTVAVVTKPFRFEGRHRMKNAAAGIEELKKYVDTLIVIPNQRLLEVIDRNTSMLQAFKKADETLRQGVQGIADLISKPGEINLDFADVHTIMSGKGIAHMGVGRAKGKDRVQLAAEMAINSPLLETSIKGATHVLVSIAGDTGLSLTETDSTMNYINDMVDPEAEIIYGTTMDDSLDDEVVITVIATGLEDESASVENQPKRMTNELPQQVRKQPQINLMNEQIIAASPINNEQQPVHSQHVAEHHMPMQGPYSMYGMSDMPMPGMTEPKPMLQPAQSEHYQSNNNRMNPQPAGSYQQSIPVAPYDYSNYESSEENGNVTFDIPVFLQNKRKN